MLLLQYYYTITIPCAYLYYAMILHDYYKINTLLLYFTILVLYYYYTISKQLLYFFQFLLYLHI